MVDNATTTKRNCAGTVAASVLISAIVAAAVSYGMLALMKSDAVPFAAPGEPNSEMVLNTIRENPQVIIESLENMRAQQIAEQQTKAREQLSSSRQQLTQDPDSPVIGNPQGDVTVVEFFDYNCGYCKRMAPVIEQLIQDDSNVRVVLKEFPILSPGSELAARASLAVYQVNPDAYLEFHQALMQHDGAYEEAFLLDTAQRVGADRDAVRAAMQSEAVAKEITENQQLASQLGIQGTPALVIGDTLIPGAVDLEQVKAAIAQARNGGEAQPLAAQDGDAATAADAVAETDMGEGEDTTEPAADQ